MKCLVSSLLVLFTINLTAHAKVVNKLDELNDQEIAVIAEIDLKLEPKKLSDTKWKSCVPQESQKFPEGLSAELQKEIFTSKELEDLAACGPGSCKHNFLPYEVELLAKIKDKEKLKEQFFRFYKNRVQGLTPISPLDAKLRFKGKENLSPFCSNEDLTKFLKNRPEKNAEYRLSVVQYDDRMRPTTRLLQGSFYEDKDERCYVEGLIFSNHYDIDRVELWGLSKEGKLQLMIRHRIDLLNSWWRRLQKPKLQEALQKAASDQLQRAADCLNKQ